MAKPPQPSQQMQHHQTEQRMYVPLGVVESLS